MSTTSGTYYFSSPQIKELVDDAYERVGITPPLITEQKIVSALRSLNFILQEWVNKGNNLWTIKQGMLGLNPNQNAYQIPANGIDIKTATIRTSNRNLGGTAFSSSGGIAQNAFDNNPSTACNQIAPQGYISYNWGQAQYAIAMVGIQSAISANYTLNFEYSYDNINWNAALSIPAQNYPVNNIQWFVIPTPVPANVFRVRELNSSVLFWSNISAYTWLEYTPAPTITWATWNNTPLSIEEIYFNTALYDTLVTRLSEYEYTALPNKNQVGRPTSFWVDRQINPIIYLWPTPTAQYNNLFFTYWEAIQDVGQMINSAEIPARFLEALCAALSYRLAIKEGANDRIPMLQALAEEAYASAAGEDRERVPLRIYGDYMQGWTSV